MSACRNTFVCQLPITLSQRCCLPVEYFLSACKRHCLPVIQTCFACLLKVSVFWSNGLLQTYCRPVADLLSACCRPIVSLLQTYCLPVANLFSAYCRPIVGLLQTYCRPVANLLSACCRPVVCLLRTYCRPVARTDPGSCASEWLAWIGPDRRGKGLSGRCLLLGLDQQVVCVLPLYEYLTALSHNLSTLHNFIQQSGEVCVICVCVICTLWA